MRPWRASGPSAPRWAREALFVATRRRPNAGPLLVFPRLQGTAALQVNNGYRSLDAALEGVRSLGAGSFVLSRQGMGPMLGLDGFRGCKGLQPLEFGRFLATAVLGCKGRLPAKSITTIEAIRFFLRIVDRTKANEVMTKLGFDASLIFLRNSESFRRAAIAEA